MSHEKDFETLFQQLGLDSSTEAIDIFISTHQLPADVLLIDADFWTESQRQFLKESIATDSMWSLVVDRLNQELHEDSEPHR